MVAINPEPMGRTAPGYSPSADSARLAMTAGRLAVEAVNQGADPEHVYNAIRNVTRAVTLDACLDTDLQCDNEKCEECYG